MANRILSSKWGGLSASLLASIYPVDARGLALPSSVTVVAPITDSNIELTANWQSPFEQSGAEIKAPFLMGLLQSGTLESYVPALLGKGYDQESGLIADIGREAVAFSREAQGRSGMTKLNSTQVFTGAAPLKIPLTLHFRAFEDPQSEVQECIDALAQWTLARQLAANGGLAQAIVNLREGGGFLKALLPSESPQMVGLRYGGYTYAPMVVEGMTMPLTVPRGSRGEPLHVAVQLTLATLTALDSDDWTRALQGRPTKLFNNT